MHARSFPIFTIKVKSKRYHVVPYGELDGIPIALVARFGLEFARRLGLYQAVELEEEGFNVYFEGVISREDNLSLSRSHTSTIRNLILRVIHNMITYGLCQRTTRLGVAYRSLEE
ncbi:hypothetical protein Tco_1048842 [Tanacetum coccineum]